MRVGAAGHDGLPVFRTTAVPLSGCGSTQHQQRPDHSFPAVKTNATGRLGMPAVGVAIALLAFTAVAACIPDSPMFLADSGRSTAARTDPKLNTANASTRARKWKARIRGLVPPSKSILGAMPYVGSWGGHRGAGDTTGGTQ